MKKLNELKQDRSAINEKINVLLLEEEMTEEQRGEVTDLEGQIESLKNDIELMERQEKRNKEMASVNIIVKDEKDETPNFGEAVRNLMIGKLDAIPEMYRNENGTGIVYRADPLLTSTTAAIINKTVADGLSIKQSEGEAFVRGLGTTVYEGLNGNFVVPSMAELTASIAAENVDVSTADATPAALTLAARRFGATQSFTKEFLQQTNTGIYSGIVQNLVDSIWVKINYDLFDSFVTDANDASTAGTATGLTYGDIVGLEGGVPYFMTSPAYVTTHAVKSYLKQMNASSAGIKFAWGDDDVMNAHKALANAGANANHVYYGDWKESAIGLWGGLELIVDPYTSSKAGKIVLVASQLADTGIANYRAFKFIPDASAAI